MNAQKFPVTDITCGDTWSEQDIFDWCEKYNHPISPERIIERIRQGADLSIEDGFLTWIEYDEDARS